MMLETSRLVLREMTPNDIDDLMTIFSDALAMRYYPSTKTVEEGLAWIHWNQSSYHGHGFGLWIMERKEDGCFIGQCGLTVQQIPALDQKRESAGSDPEVGSSPHGTLSERERKIGTGGGTSDEKGTLLETEIGYLLSREHWGYGYATEAAAGCRDWGFSNLEVSRLVSIISVYNKPSIRVAERVGMQLWKDFTKPNGIPHHVYAMSRGEWESGRSRP